MKPEIHEMGTSRSFKELVLELVASADEVASLAKDSESESQAMSELSIYLEKLPSILDTIRQDKVMDTPGIRSAIGSLEAQLHRARACIESSPNARANVQEMTHDLGRSLGLLLFASVGVSLDLKEKIGALHKEMMNVKFDESYEREIEEVDEACSEKEEGKMLGIEDVALQLKYGNDEEFKCALMGLEMLIREKDVDCDWIIDEGIIVILFNRLGASKCVERLRIIKVLRIISYENDQAKEQMVDVNSLTTLVKSLARDERERREAVGLLMELSHFPCVRRRIGRIQGCIIMLVAILNGDDPLASHDAGKLLHALSCNTQNALLMAEAGYFQPLIQHLRQGSEMSKILMATALARMVLTDKARDSLGEDGVVEPLVFMFKTGKLEAKLAALNALQNLLISTKNVSNILSSGILPPLLQLLFSVTSSVMTLREPASAILSKVALSNSIVEYKDLPNQLLSLLNLSNSKIKCHVLVALNNIASHPSASEVRSKMTQNGAMQLLLPLLKETDSKIRVSALNLLYTITKDVSEDYKFSEVVGGDYLQIIVGLVSSSSWDSEKAASVGLLSNTPVGDKRAIDKLKKANLLPMLVSLMGSSSSSSSMCQLQESAAAIFIKFTLPSDKKVQLSAIEVGVIPVLVKLLSNGSSVAKCRAAISLAQLSQNTTSLRRPRNRRWCVPSPTVALCEVHDRSCTIKGGFCLVKSGAVLRLIQILEGEKRSEADEAALSALATLLQDDLWENGSNFIVKIQGAVENIVRILELGNLKAQEKALSILERIFRTENHRTEYGGVAQVVLINLAQKGEPSLRSAVAKLLAQLQLLQEQSSYF